MQLPTCLSGLLCSTQSLLLAQAQHSVILPLMCCELLVQWLHTVWFQCIRISTGTRLALPKQHFPGALWSPPPDQP